MLPAEQSLALSRLNVLTGADVSLILPASGGIGSGGIGSGGATVSLVPEQLPVIAPTDLAAEYEGSRMVLEPSASEMDLVAELAAEEAAASGPMSAEGSGPGSAPVSASRLRVQQMSQQLVDIAAALSPASASMLLDNNASMVVPVLPTSICEWVFVLRCTRVAGSAGCARRLCVYGGCAELPAACRPHLPCR